MSVYLKDIAKLAGVSTATVSRVLNDKVKGNMRQETYERIEQIIRETGYTPHALASGLRKGFSNVVGVIIPDNVNPYYAQLSKSVEHECFKHGYLTLICNTNSDVNRERFYMKHLTGQRVSGILFCSTGLSGSEIKSLVHPGIRIILLDEELSDYNGEVVVGDDFKGGYIGAQYLFSLGHSSILLITGLNTLSSTHNRLSGFLRFVQESGKKFNLNMKFEGNYTIDSGFKAVNEAIRRGLDFSAIFSFNDMMAIGAIKALVSHKIRVPEDVSVLGYDNIFIDELIKPGLTTVATPFEELGKLAVQKLLGFAKDNRVRKKRLLLSPTLIERETCIPYNNKSSSRGRKYAYGKDS
ncbi:MAG: LacI family DNA-binding transcriptional regulator [Spirochaetota bacterium]